MNIIEQLQQALSIPKEQSRVMTVVFVAEGKAKLEADGVVVYVTGNWAIGTRLVVAAGNVVAIVPESSTIIYTD